MILLQRNRHCNTKQIADETRICTAEMAVRYAALSACRKVDP